MKLSQKWGWEIAGEKTGRRVYGMELSETLCDVIITRWQEFSGKTAVLDGEGATYAEMRTKAWRGQRSGLMWSRVMSLVEAITNVVVGYGVAVAKQMVVFPRLGLSTRFSQDLQMGLIFTAA
ncbi:DUF7220 family protein [Methylocystis echinoides]|uniref:Uncharacterized protein n=1 Tax=Methylocystis echinoides TaxID=29468 RepID=A0A9W6GYX3_9HYPH|nr:hypothetical protein [Methylocystis echinoides]GLI95449.1 hypothetical protein LMG27198_44410 [Methylocystis echinoides]